MAFRAASFLLLIVAFIFSCNTTDTKKEAAEINASFKLLQERFLDSFWRQNPAHAISVGYGKYYDQLNVYDSAAISQDVTFSRRWLDSLKNYNYDALDAGEKINYNIIRNALESNIWNIDTFKSQEWNPAQYNIGSACYGILNQTEVSLNQKLSNLSGYLENSGAYYLAAAKNIKKPTREHTELAIPQNKGTLDLFGSSLMDSINSASLPTAGKDSLLLRISKTKEAINGYVGFLNKLLSDSSTQFRDFRIGKDLYKAKFNYNLVTDISPEQLYQKAIEAKESYHKEMYSLAQTLWPKYAKDITRPTDSLLLIKTIIDKVSEKHVSPKNLMDTIRSQVSRLQAFIKRKNLFDYDTSYPLQVRVTPSYASGFSVASANFPPPYQKTSITYYNIDDLTKIPAEKAESQLREYNDYMLQILSIHEAMPGHCLQGVYNSKNQSGMVKSVFSNGAMIEGWAVYVERMMLENGWGNNEPELWLMFYKWSLRECTNVIVDYGLHCLDFSKEDIVNLLVNEAFQEPAQVEEKYKRARLSQVQLCSYFNGATDIVSLRDAYKEKKGSNFSLEDFHERFLSYGSAPVKYIRELMLQ
jgi:uncharacterized protein (DUF885 family)